MNKKSTQKNGRYAQFLVGLYGLMNLPMLGNMVMHACTSKIAFLLILFLSSYPFR